MGATLPQLRGTARLTVCPDCQEPHGVVFRLGHTPVVECPLLPSGEVRLRWQHEPPTIVVGSAIITEIKKSPRRTA